MGKQEGRGELIRHGSPQVGGALQRPELADERGGAAYPPDAQASPEQLRQGGDGQEPIGVGEGFHSRRRGGTEPGEIGLGVVVDDDGRAPSRDLADRAPVPGGVVETGRVVDRALNVEDRGAAHAVAQRLQVEMPVVEGHAANTAAGAGESLQSAAVGGVL